MALASVQGWGRLMPPWLLSAGLWGAAAVQLAYPIAETVVKALILVGAMEPNLPSTKTGRWDEESKHAGGQRLHRGDED